jgi:hypothetical protein
VEEPQLGRGSGELQEERPQEEKGSRALALAACCLERASRESCACRVW